MVMQKESAKLGFHHGSGRRTRARTNSGHPENGRWATTAEGINIDVYQTLKCLVSAVCFSLLAIPVVSAAPPLTTSH